MKTSQPPLDPRKSPWKRGDVCTSGFTKTGFVLSYTPEYLEVRWTARGGVEKIPTEEIENLLRTAHADSPSTDGTKTNLELLEAVEALSRISEALKERMATVKNDNEKKELDRLSRRIFATDKCDWDDKNHVKILRLLIDPKNAGVIFKFRDRLHRVFCKRHEK